MRHLSLLAAAALPFVSAPGFAAVPTLKAEDSFRIGSGGVMCTAQARLADPALVSMFDRGYGIVCRDAAAPVGRLFALRTGAEGAAAQSERAAEGLGDCAAEETLDLGEAGNVRRRVCRDEAGLNVQLYAVERAGTLYIARGLAGYESALQLGLRTLVADRPVAGDVEVSMTGAGDAATFARVQAGTLDPGQLLAQGYVRNNAGSYAEAAAFFGMLVERGSDGDALGRAGEYLANQALQQSNLGNFAEAESLFARAEAALDRTDPLQARLLRNFRAIDQLNRGRPAGALAALDAPLAQAGGQIGLERDRVAQGFIDRPVAQRLNAEDARLARLGGVDGRLTPEERLEILEAQATFLRGAAERALGRPAEAEAALRRAGALLAGVRGGRVASTLWLRAASLAELSALAEAQGRGAEARTLLSDAVQLYEAEYPGSAALLAARARLAGLLVRLGDAPAATALYRDIVAASPRTPGAFQALRGLITPYFDLLIARGAQDPSAGADLFEASQILTRPGVAQTQAVLARELSGGSDEAAALFRQSTTLSRDVIRSEATIARLAAKPQRTPEEDRQLAETRAELDALSREQTALLARLADFPRYRVIASDLLPLARLQAALTPEEAYYKLVLIEDRAYGLFATRDRARVVRVGAPVAELDKMVAQLRDTIVKLEDGAPVTYPFDVETARKLYLALFGELSAELAQARHLVFEPDGPLLTLPANLLVMEEAGLAAYRARIARPGADKFDLTGIAWLGRDRLVSTAVSPRAFVDVRAIAPSRAGKSFLGLGANSPALLAPPARLGEAGADGCDWPLDVWNAPISSAELRLGAAALGSGEVLTDAAFTDTALRARDDLAQYRVIHFATHGLVTAPRPECPARPALVTSFGATQSDGLLSFAEIFDLRLDADTVILSACDTAGMATVAATREAGIATGGNYALDGLVRAFVGAGARAVIASHWPVPDDYDATRTLISGLYAEPGALSVGEALRRSQVRLMDDPLTSHPYYWSGFAIIGDAAKPLTAAR